MEKTRDDLDDKEARKRSFQEGHPITSELRSREIKKDKPRGPQKMDKAMFKPRWHGQEVRWPRIYHGKDKVARKRSFQKYHPITSELRSREIKGLKSSELESINHALKRARGDGYNSEYLRHTSNLGPRNSLSFYGHYTAHRLENLPATFSFKYIQDKMGVTSVKDKIRKARLRWFGHVQRRCTDVLCRGVRG
ncbi:hypothetical protein RND71_030658 [Anisodus tanguticus]|uniref:Uncharacterized protein n=1 Tax=Anisodus tanguticus TaxID=243964 RepID=A0AAE1RGU4_9SOLA|nr:hypothetical protein RND71_030658 [Anisodus tanguticus]